VPVVGVPPGAPRSPRTDDVVVGVDGSAHGDTALRFALDHAAASRARVVAVCAWRVPDGPRWDEDPSRLVRAERAARADASRTVEAAVSRVRTDAHAEVAVEVFVLDGRPGTALRETARGAALTVVGSRGLGDAQGRLLGSVSQAVLVDARAPVAVVHAGRG
jgi:nucleotide-binding universal stress UspA family protein